MYKLGCRIFLICILLGCFFIPADRAFALCDNGTCYVARDGSGDFNCDGNNDQVEINKAIDFAASSSTVNTVHLKGSATYVIDDPIYVKSDMVLEGDSSATVMLASSANWSDLYQGLVDGKLAVSGSRGINNIVIRGFKIDGNRSNQSQGVGNGYYNAIKLFKADNVEIYNMYISNNLGDGVLIDHGSVTTNDSNISIHDNTMYKVGHDGVYLKRLTGADVYKNKITCNVNGGVRLYAVNHAKVYANTINAENSGGAGIQVENSDGEIVIDDMEIYGNTIYETAMWGVLLLGGEGSTLANSKNVYIHHNLIFGTGTSYGDQKTGGITIYGFHNTIIENNTLDYNRKGAIVVDSHYSNLSQYPDTYVQMGGFNTIVRNNIISHGRSYDYGSDHYGYGILNMVPETHSFSVYNNCFFDNPAGNFKNATAGSGNIYADPQYVSWSIHQNTGTFSDYHLKSKAGRWNGTSWVTDTVSSPCIDAGYASSSYANEPSPNGSRINIGRYGNTAEASKSGSSPAPSPTTYALTVNSGTGDGTYASGANVTITADAPASGKVFDKWTGDTAYIASTTSSTTNVTMPAKAITLTATYKTPTVATYALTVVSGTGDGTYAPGTTVTIKADAPASGKVFDKWTGDTTYLSSLTSSSSTLTMPSRAISLTATYKTLEPLKYALNVVSGTGDGGYVSGTQITITADSPIMGREFDKWTGDTSYLASTTSATTQVTMPAKAITLTATYKDKPDTYYITVNSGSGDGYYAPNAKVSITAAPAVSGMVFDQWTGNVECLSSANSATSIVTMPSKSIALTAHYVAIPTPVTEHTLTVNSGTGDGNYAQGAKVTITADTPASGNVFYRWTGDTTYILSATSATTTLTMPSRAITLTATYKPATLTKYALTVTSGTGDGSYAQGAIVSIKADTPATGKVFDKWTGDIEYVASVTSSTTNVTMPSKAITLTALYKAQDSSLPDGTLIKLPDSNKVYIVINGEKKWISTPEMFEQLGCDWADIELISQTILDTYTDFEDNLIRTPGDIKVYLVVNGIKRHIPSPQVFLNYGFDWKDIKEVSSETQSQYRNAYLVRQSGTQEVYYLSPTGVRKHIPTQTIFDSYQDNWQDVQVISQQEMESYPISNLIRLENSNDVYLLESSIKRHITSSQVFTRYGYDWNRILSVNRTEFDYYKTGSEVK